MIITSALNRDGITDIVYTFENMQNLGIKESGHWRGRCIERLNVGVCDIANIYKLLLQLPENNSGLLITFNAPKTASIMALVADDKRIFDAHDHSVAVVLSYMEENFAQALLQSGGVVDTGELAVVTYRGYTEESGDERKPLPHLHTSCLLLNMTFINNMPTAIYPQQIYEWQHLLEQLYQNELGNKLMSLDYATTWSDKGNISTMEIKGVEWDIIEAFSKT